jgi:hypothetical protein
MTKQCASWPWEEQIPSDWVGIFGRFARDDNSVRWLTAADDFKFAFGAVAKW